MTEMTTINVSMPRSLKKIVDREVKLGGYSSVSELFRELVRERNKAQQALKRQIQEGIDSGPATPWTRSDSQKLKQAIVEKFGKPRSTT